MSRFKKGDVVRCIDSNQEVTKGENYLVESDSDMTYTRVWVPDLDGTVDCFNTRFELVSSEQKLLHAAKGVADLLKGSSIFNDHEKLKALQEVIYEIEGPKLLSEWHDGNKVVQVVETKGVEEVVFTNLDTGGELRMTTRQYHVMYNALTWGDGS